MTTRTIQVYPSPENCQHTTGEPVQARTYVEYLSQVLASLPAEEAATATIVGTADLRILAAHTLSDIEVLTEQVVRAREFLAQNSGPLTDLQRAELMQILSLV